MSPEERVAQWVVDHNKPVVVEPKFIAVTPEIALISFAVEYNEKSIRELYEGKI